MLCGILINGVGAVRPAFAPGAYRLISFLVFTCFDMGFIEAGWDNPQGWGEK